MVWLLDALRGWPISPEVLAQLRAMPEWEQAVTWGWIMASGELTGGGTRHAGEHPEGHPPLEGRNLRSPTDNYTSIYGGLHAGQ